MYRLAMQIDKTYPIFHFFLRNYIYCSCNSVIWVSCNRSLWERKWQMYWRFCMGSSMWLLTKLDALFFVGGFTFLCVSVLLANVNGILKVLSLYIFAYVCTVNMPSMCWEMKRRSIRKLDVSTGYAISGASIIYILCA